MFFFFIIFSNFFFYDVSGLRSDAFSIDKDRLFYRIRKEMDATSSFKEIHNLARKYDEILNQFPLSLCNNLENHSMDPDSSFLFPDDFPFLTPLKIYGDGNCLPRCASLIAYGVQDMHDEMRIRITFELALHEELYLENKCLQKGHPLPDNLPNIYAMYSDHYHGQKITSATVRSIFQMETQDVSKPGSYMGVWQVHSLANILKCKIM